MLVSKLLGPGLILRVGHRCHWQPTRTVMPSHARAQPSSPSLPLGFVLCFPGKQGNTSVYPHWLNTRVLDVCRGLDVVPQWAPMAMVLGIPPALCAPSRGRHGSSAVLRLSRRDGTNRDESPRRARPLARPRCGAGPRGSRPQSRRLGPTAPLRCNGTARQIRPSAGTAFPPRAG